MTYDNFEYTDGRRGDRLGDKRSFRSVTTALVFNGQGIPEGGLRQSMWQPNIPLRTIDVVNKVQRDNLFFHTRRYFIECAIKEALGAADPKLATRWVIEPPEDQPFNRNRTQCYPLPPVMKDQGSNENNMSIIETIFETQFGITKEDPQFDILIRIVFGDLKTVDRMRSIKSIRDATGESPFDTLHWLMPGLGLWHLRYNFLQLLHHIHWGGSSPVDPSTLQYAADRLGRTQCVQPNKFQQQDELQRHSYSSRKMGILLQFMVRDGRDIQSKSDCKDWVASRGTGGWSNRIDQIFPRLHPDPETHVEDQVDEIWRNHARFCNHIETYMLLSYAIKQADIGLLRRAMAECCVMFQSKVGRKHAYARELIRQLHLIDSPAATKELQDAVLVNSLVNLRGEKGKTFETDRLLELHNLALRTFFKERSSSTLEDDDLLVQCSLNGPYFKLLQTKVEGIFGHLSSNRHPQKGCIRGHLQCRKGTSNR